MTLLLLSSLAAASFGRRRVAATGVFFGLASVILLAGGPLPKLLLAHLQNHPRLENPDFASKNVIVVLGLGTVRDHDFVWNQALGFARVGEAARLYHLCRTDVKRECLVVTSGGDVAGTGLSEAAVMARDLAGLGVPDVIIEDQSRDTIGNARETKRILGAKAFGRLILVTSGFHLRRATRIFETAFGEVTSAPADHLGASWWPSARGLAYVELALHEFAGYLLLL